ncbi:SH3 domain-containing protein [Donghicola mangrovi]|uniref:SH3 domain-containing protein n=1 Tax=Donghicola mangrovi TaxID=2729614 RepID=A0A850Q7I4_9RHOB|nr:SH3 domain-containing protein [Donghicola mangrovi]NVO24913.1 SH3 domain-containing protein [Donghicola mangrovi]
MKKIHAVFLFCLLFPGFCLANESLSERAARLAVDSCTVSSVQGVVRNSRNNLVLSSSGSSQNIEVTEESWNGIQQVLREHQQIESANYRECVRELTKRFIEAEAIALPQFVTCYVDDVRPPDDWLALRTEPSTSRGVRLAKLAPGESIKFLGDRTGDWHRVETADGSVGWVSWKLPRWISC